MRAFEVEQKFRLLDPSQLAERLAELGAAFGEPSTQIDRYFSHPSRDFATTDEALRVRQSEGSVCITFKGPVTDEKTKTRREIELQMSADESASDCVALFQALGFAPVRAVTKTRRVAKLNHLGHKFEVSHDEVADLGLFAEVETIAHADDVEEAQAALMSLTDQLRLGHVVQGSYLGMLLDQDA